MDLAAASLIARELMQKHGLVGWTFRWDRAEQRLGQCVYARRTITMSHKMVAAADEAQVRQTMLHEIAHALTPGHKHDKVWLAKARSIGYEGERLSRNPHVEQRARAALRPEYASLEPAANIAVGTTAIVIRGSLDLLGQHVHVLKVNPKTYRIVTAIGEQYSATKDCLAVVDDGVVVPAPVIHRFTPGDTAVIAQGSRAGTVVSIVGKRGSRIVGEFSDGARFTCPPLALRKVA